MNSPIILRSLLAPATLFTRFRQLPAAGRPALRGLAASFAAAMLAGCGHAPDTTASVPTAPAAALAPAPVAVPAPVVAAPALAPAPVPTKAVAKPKLTKVSQPTAAVAPAPVAADEAPAAPAPAPEAAPAAPATRTQAGRVLDENGRPLIGATVMLRGSTKGTSTDANGSYTLEVPAGENTFVVGYGGYEDETATSRDGQPINVTLLPTPSSKTKSRRQRR